MTQSSNRFFSFFHIILNFNQLVIKASPLVLGLISLHFLNNAFVLPDLEALKNGLDPETSLKILPRLTIFLLISLFLYIYTILIVGFHSLQHNEQTFFSFFNLNFLPLLTDITRAFNKVLIFLLCLILPGLYKAVRLIFVPYASMENKNIDALELSNTLTRSTKVKILLAILFLISIPFDLITSKAIEKSPLSITLVLSTYASLYPLFYHSILASLYSGLERQFSQKTIA